MLLVRQPERPTSTSSSLVFVSGHCRIPLVMGQQVARKTDSLQPTTLKRSWSRGVASLQSICERQDPSGEGQLNEEDDGGRTLVAGACHCAC